jgi:Zn-dependent peptidase ImmA (M78 family)
LYNDRYNTSTSIKRIETICNAVAAEVLVPQDIFITEWNSAVSVMNSAKAIDNLSRTFKCGITVIARKAFENGFISWQQYISTAEAAVRHYNENKKRKKEKGDGGGDFYRTVASRLDQRFFKMLVNSVAEGRTLYSDAFRLTNTNRSTFSTLIEKTGGGTR